jgi:hypothetical protein
MCVYVCVCVCVYYPLSRGLAHDGVCVEVGISGREQAWDVDTALFNRIRHCRFLFHDKTW